MPFGVLTGLSLPTPCQSCCEYCLVSLGVIHVRHAGRAGAVVLSTRSLRIFLRMRPSPHPMIAEFGGGLVVKRALYSLIDVHLKRTQT